jgi:hypothetical protein
MRDVNPDPACNHQTKKRKTNETGLQNPIKTKKDLLVPLSKLISTNADHLPRPARLDEDNVIAERGWNGPSSLEDEINGNVNWYSEEPQRDPGARGYVANVAYDIDSLNVIISSFDRQMQEVGGGGVDCFRVWFEFANSADQPRDAMNLDDDEEAASTTPEDPTESVPTNAVMVLTENHSITPVKQDVAVTTEKSASKSKTTPHSASMKNIAAVPETQDDAATPADPESMSAQAPGVAPVEQTQVSAENKDEATTDFKLFSSCRRLGHETKRCVMPTENGYIKHCVFCNN